MPKIKKIFVCAVVGLMLMSCDGGSGKQKNPNSSSNENLISSYDTITPKPRKEVAKPAKVVDNRVPLHLTEKVERQGNVTLYKISWDVYEKAFKNFDKYNTPIFTDKVENNSVTQKIIKDAKSRYKKQKRSSEYADTQEENLYNIKEVVKFRNLPLYGFHLMQYPDDFLYLYALQGEYVGQMLYPYTQSPTGIMVSQRGYDCDWNIDVEFYTYNEASNKLEKVSKFYNEDISGEPLIRTQPPVDEFDPGVLTFWGGDDELYFKLSDNEYYKFIIK